MKKGYLSILLICLSLVVWGQQWEWATSICGGQGIGDRITIMDNDYTIVSGRIRGTFQLPNATISDTGLFIAQYDPQGELTWIDTIHGNYVNIYQRLRTDAAGNCYFSFYGSNNGKGLAKYSFSGERKWIINNQGAHITGMDVSPSGDVFISGWYTSNAAFCDTVLSAPHGVMWSDTETYIAKIDSNGSCVWVRGIPGSTGTVSSVVCDNKGSVYLASNVKDTAIFNSSTMVTVPGSFIAKYSSDGSVLFAKSISASSYQKTGFLQRDPITSDLYLAGDFSGTIGFDNTSIVSAGEDDIYFLKMDSLGNYIWAGQIGTSYFDHIFGMEVDEQGNLYMNGFQSGSFNFGNGYVSPGNDMFIVRYSPAKQCQGYWSMGYSYSPYASSIAVRNNMIGVTGGFSDSLSLGSFQLYCNYTHNVFAGVFSPLTTGMHHQESAAAELNVYPNPSYGEALNIRSKGNGIIMIRDLAGRTVLLRRITSPIQSIDVNDLSHGTYLIEFISGENRSCYKFIISK